MRPMAVIRLGPVAEELCETLCRFLAQELKIACALEACSLDPAFARNRERGQTNARDILAALENRERGPGTLVLGITEEDLYSPVFTFVFGEAELGGRNAVFSLNRLRPERYGLPADEALLLSRARREALHETGHLLGLAHCKSPDCAMRFSGSAEEIDLKKDRLCPVCREGIGE